MCGAKWIRARFIQYTQEFVAWTNFNFELDNIRRLILMLPYNF